MVVARVTRQQLHDALLHGLSLSQAEFAASATQLYACAATVLTLEAGKIAHSQTSSIPRASEDDKAGHKSRLAALAVFHKLSSLPNGIPITLVSLHDFIIVFTSPGSPASANEARLARRVVDTLFRKKPSLVRALESQLLPAWSEMMTSFQPSLKDNWLQEATALFTSINTLSRINALHETLQNSSSSSAFWTALQSFYDICLPGLFSASIPTKVQSVLQIANIEEYARLRKEIVDFFNSFFPALSAETLSQCLENEASNPELPTNLTDLPLTSLVNMTLLQDAEYYHSISRRVGLRKIASSSISAEERSYLQNALDFGKMYSKDSICDILSSMNKGKGKAVSNGHSNGDTNSEKITQMTAQVLNILPDASVQDIRRLLMSSALEQVADDQKAERVISMLLEGESEVPHEPVQPLQSENDSQDTQQVARKRSTLASVRRNVFNDAIDVSRLHRGKQDFQNDTFLPTELRASILAAAERQAQESEEDNSDDEEELLAEIDEDQGVSSTVNVKDDVSEESGLDDETEGTLASASRSNVKTGANNRGGMPSTSSDLGRTGVPKELESLYITTYTRDASVFSREAKKSPARAELKKKIAALHLAQSIADEQIEGWARMLERNPKKDKILERFNDKQFQGNQKGFDVTSKAGQSQANQAEHEKDAEGAGSAQGGKTERGRGRGRGRGGSRQSDQRRRGHDRKMQKAGAM